MAPTLIPHVPLLALNAVQVIKFIFKLMFFIYFNLFLVFILNSGYISGVGASSCTACPGGYTASDSRIFCVAPWAYCYLVVRMYTSN